MSGIGINMNGCPLVSVDKLTHGMFPCCMMLSLYSTRRWEAVPVGSSCYVEGKQSLKLLEFKLTIFTNTAINALTQIQWISEAFH